MDRVSSTGYQTISGRRTWQDKNLGAGIQGTTFDQVWFAGVQESIIALAEQTGITPADQTLGSTDLQAVQGTRRIAGGNVTTVSATTATLTADNAGLVLVNAASNNVAITLPAAASAGGQPFEFIFVRTDTSAHTVSWAVPGSGAGSTDTAVPSGSLPGALAVGAYARIRNDGVSKWAAIGGAGNVNGQNPYFNVSTSSLSGTTGNNANYTLLSQAVTFPSTSRTGGFRLRMRGYLQGHASGQLNQNFTLAISDGTTTQYGAQWLILTVATEIVALESGFLFPTLYAPGATITLTLTVGTAGGGYYPSNGMVMQAASLQIAVEDA